MSAELELQNPQDEEAEPVASTASSSKSPTQATSSGKKDSASVPRRGPDRSKQVQNAFASSLVEVAKETHRYRKEKDAMKEATKERIEMAKLQSSEKVELKKLELEEKKLALEEMKVKLQMKVLGLDV